MEFHTKDWSDLIAMRPLLKAVLHFFWRKDPILSTAIVARPAKAGIKVAKPLFALNGYEGGAVLKNSSVELSPFQKG